LAYATSNRGGCHLRAYPISHEILRKPVATDRFSFEGKARIIKIAEDMNAVVDSLTACKFVFFAATLEEYAKAVSAVTGSQHTTQSLLRTGERIYVLERYLNSLNGFTCEDDDLPRRFFAEEGSSSANIKVKPLDREEFLNARNNYYRIRGYGEDGVPGRELMVKLGLEDFL
jgi:aldehyde:ferredoxin oxidoreductase